MKKLMLAILSMTMVLSGCSKEEEAEEEVYSGPLVSEDPRSDKEKTLIMIQNCISDYNEDRISEVEEYIGTELHALPIEVDKLPEIDSLDDLETIKIDEDTENIFYGGYYMVDEKYKVDFYVYNPTGGSFWLNGRINFEIDPSLVTYDDTRYTEYREAFLDLLSREYEVLNYLYGLNLQKSTKDDVIEGYYEVYSAGSHEISSIADLKALAETVFDKDYLEYNFYYSAFYNDTPIFKEQDGRLYATESGMFEQSSSHTYNAHYIIAAKTDDDMVYVDMLSETLGELQPDIKRLALVKTDHGYRLPSAY